VVFGLFGKKKRQEPADPLLGFDAALESVRRQAAQARQSAATLLALRGELQRDLTAFQGKAEALRRRLLAAGGDAKATRTLNADLAEVTAREVDAAKALSAATTDGEVLLEVAGKLSRQLRELEDERRSAQRRLKASAAVTAALARQVQAFSEVMALDEARSEVERAHALAELYRDDAER